MSEFSCTVKDCGRRACEPGKCKLYRSDKMSEAKNKYYKLKIELEQMGHEGFRGEIDEYVSELKAEKAELIESYRELLVEAIGLYSHYPNNFRYTEKEYFKNDIELLKKHGVEI